MAGSPWCFQNTGCPQGTEGYIGGRGLGLQTHHTLTILTTPTSSRGRAACCRAPPPCVALGRCPRRRLGLGLCRSGSSCSAHRHTLPSILTRRTSKTTHHPLGKAKCCTPGIPGTGPGRACPRTWAQGCCKRASGSECPCYSHGCTVTTTSRLTRPR